MSLSLPILILAILFALSLVALGIVYRRGQTLEARLGELSERAQNRRTLEDRVQSLAIQHHAMTTVTEAAYNALLLVNSDHQVLTMNAAARTLFNQPGDWKARTESLISLTLNHELDDLVAATLESGDEMITQQVMFHAQPYRVRVLCTESPDGPLIAIALEDISEIHRLGRARRDMVANISHELRTPITSIRLLVDTLTRGAIRDPKKAAPLVEKIAIETDTLQQMAQELLDLSMIESGRAEFKLIAVGMRDIADDAFRRLSEMAERYHLTIENQIDPAVRVLADAEMITRVLTNLLHNAIKFTPEGGEIRMALLPGDEWITIMVTDSGPGIPIVERQRIFERFYRADRARQGGGTGLGLAIAKHIVEAHGGRIWADDPPLRSDGVGGAHICFTLPTAES